jgi:hypothetical protein
MSFDEIGDLVGGLGQLPHRTITAHQLPAHPQLVHWSVPDPALEGSTNRASYPAFEPTAAEPETRISFLLHLLSEPPTRRSTHAKR